MSALFQSNVGKDLSASIVRVFCGLSLCLGNRLGKWCSLVLWVEFPVIVGWLWR